MRRKWIVFGFSIVLVYLASLVNSVAAQTAVPTPTPCEALLAPDRLQFSGPNAPTIRIVTPADGSTLYGSSFTVSVELQNFDIATTDGRHWHFWVNGQLAGMVYQKDVIVDLAPGVNHICASMGDANHADLGEPASATVTVFQAAAGTPTTPPSAPAGTGKLLPDGVISPVQIAMIVVIGLVAAVGGWWLGSRLPKSKK